MDSHAHVQSARHRAQNGVVSSSQRPVLRLVCDPRPPPPLPVRGLEVTICASSRRDVDAREGGAEPDARLMLTHAKYELQRRRNFSSVYDCSCLRGMYPGAGRRATARWQSRESFHLGGEESRDCHSDYPTPVYTKVTRRYRPVSPGLLVSPAFFGPGETVAYSGWLRD